MEQEEALKRHEKEIEKANREAEEKEVGGLLGNPELATRYAQLDEIAGKVKNSFQNAYTFYLSGIIYEILNQPNDAYIDYKKALEIYPDNPYLQKDVLRLARTLDMDEDLRAVKEKFALNDTDVAELDPGHGELVLLFEDGFVPQKEQVKIPIPVPRVGLVSIAFPIYEAKWAPPAPLQVNKDDLTMGTTAPICEMRALAVKALKEEAPAIATRQVLRAIAKGATRKEVKDRVGLLGGLAMDAWNFASENADLRSWITLPANAQILRTWLPAGAHKLRLQQGDSAAVGDVEVAIKEGSKTILYVVRAKDQLYSSAVSF
jgi:hypothetical protein